MTRRLGLVAFALLWPALALAQVTPAPPPVEDHSQHQAPAPPAEDHSQHQAPATPPAATATPPAAAPLPPFIPPITDADRAVAFPDVHGQMAHHDNAVNYFVLFDQLEWLAGNGDGALNWDNKGWIGRDRDRLWFRSEGERANGGSAQAEAQVFYGRAVRRWWDVVAGVRRDFGPGPARTWAAIGVQGLAPYWFEVEATAYVGVSGRTHLRLETEYELLLTNRLVLQPLVEVDVYGRDDRERGLGAGLSSTEAGVRLRYEFRRELAPYVGVTWGRKYFGTADAARAAGAPTRSARLAFGLRLWL
jgi:copper resistance protein B